MGNVIFEIVKPFLMVLAGIIGLGIFLQIIKLSWKALSLVIHKKRNQQTKLFNNLRMLDFKTLKELTPQLKQAFTTLPINHDEKKRVELIEQALQNSSIEEFKDVSMLSLKIDVLRIFEFISRPDLFQNFYKQKKSEIQEILEIVSQNDLQNIPYEHLEKALYLISSQEIPFEDFSLSFRSAVQIINKDLEQLYRVKQQTQKLADRFLNSKKNNHFWELPGIIGLEDLTLREDWVDVLIFSPGITQEQFDSLSLLRASHGIRVFICKEGNLNEVPPGIPVFWLATFHKHQDFFEKLEFWNLAVSREVTIIESVKDLIPLSKVDPVVASSRWVEFSNQLSDRQTLTSIADNTSSLVNLLEDQNESLREHSAHLIQIVAHQQNQYAALLNVEHSLKKLTSEVNSFKRSPVFSDEKMIKEILPSGQIIRKTIQIEKFKPLK